MNNERDSFGVTTKTKIISTGSSPGPSGLTLNELIVLIGNDPAAFYGGTVVSFVRKDISDFMDDPNNKLLAEINVIKNNVNNVLTPALNKAITDLSDLSNSFTLEITTVKNSLNSLDTKTSATDDTVTKIIGTIDLTQTNLFTLQEKCNTLTADLTDAQTNITTVQNDLTAYKATITTELDSLKDKDDELDLKIDDVINDLTLLETDLTTKITQLEVKYTALALEVATLSAEVTLLSEYIDTTVKPFFDDPLITITITDIDTLLTELKTKIEAVETLVNDFDLRLTDLETFETDITARVVALEAKVTGIENELIDLDTKIDDKTNDVHIVETEVDKNLLTPKENAFVFVKENNFTYIHSGGNYTKISSIDDYVDDLTYTNIYQLNIMLSDGTTKTISLSPLAKKSVHQVILNEDYIKNDIVIYDNKFYICIENITYDGTTLIPDDTVHWELFYEKNGGGGGGTTNYEDLTAKPLINGVELVGDTSLTDLSIASKDDIDGIIKSDGTLVNGKIWSGTQDEYDAIAAKDPNTIYYVESVGQQMPDNFYNRNYYENGRVYKAGQVVYVKPITYNLQGTGDQTYPFSVVNHIGMEKRYNERTTYTEYDICVRAAVDSPQPPSTLNSFQTDWTVCEPGAILEKGTNDYGEYIIYADGAKVARMKKKHTGMVANTFHYMTIPYPLIIGNPRLEQYSLLAIEPTNVHWQGNVGSSANAEQVVQQITETSCVHGYQSPNVFNGTAFVKISGD